MRDVITKLELEHTHALIANGLAGATLLTSSLLNSLGL